MFVPVVYGFTTGLMQMDVCFSMCHLCLLLNPFY
jgi:hypothetical protein